MEISSVTLRVLLLFFPGVLCALLVDALTAHRDRTPVQFLTHAFALGMGSYLSLALVRDLAATLARWLRLREPLDVTFFDALLNDHTRIAWREIALAGGVGLVLSGAIVAVLNHNLIFRGANRLGVSRKTGDWTSGRSSSAPSAARWLSSATSPATWPTTARSRRSPKPRTRPSCC